MNFAPAGKPGNARAARVLMILLLVCIFNFLDRLIISILAVPIKAEFQLTDTQLGLLGGLAFALLYAGFGLPVAWLADRWSRVKIIAIAVAVWSGFTALCGVAQNFWQLFLARMGVGIGEAGGVAPSYSLIADYFPAGSRARALAIFTFGVPIGSALGMLFGGWIASHLDWRAAFILIGVAGLPLAALVWFGITEPVRGRYDRAPEPAAAPPPTVRQAARSLAKNPSFWLLSAGGAVVAIPVYGFLFWLPSFFQRSYGLELVHVSWFYGSIVLVGGMSGMWIGAWLGDRLGRRAPAAYALVPALSFVLAAPAYAVALFTPNLTLGWILFVIPQALAYCYIGPLLAAIQQIVTANLRSTASACFLFVVNVIGLGLGTVFLGMISDRVSIELGEEGLRYAILYGLSFYIVAAIVFALAALRLAADWLGTVPAPAQPANRAADRPEPVIS